MEFTDDDRPMGWYEDTSRPGTYRLWDGKKWTGDEMAGASRIAAEAAPEPVPDEPVAAAAAAADVPEPEPAAPPYADHAADVFEATGRVLTARTAQTSPKAIIAIALPFVFWTLGAVIAIPLALAALRDIAASNGDLQGRGIALAALYISVGLILLTLGMIAAGFSAVLGG